MNIFDEAELDKKINESEALMAQEPGALREKPLDTEIPEEEVEEEQADLNHEEAEEQEPDPIDDISDEEEEPKDAKGWKSLREKKKAAKAEAEAQKQLTEKALREAQELRERLARLEGREEARAKPEIKQEAPSDPEPDADLDPDLHMQWQIRQTNKRLEEAERRAAYAEQLAKVEGTRRGLEALEKQYTKLNKIDDYDEAIEHIKNVNKNLIKLEHPNATDAQIDAHLEAEKLKIASKTYGEGLNPAEHFYKMAQALGYQKVKKSSGGSLKPDIAALNKNMPKNANLIGSSKRESPGGLPTDKVVKLSIAQLLSKEGAAALDAAEAAEERRWLDGR